MPFFHHVYPADQVEQHAEHDEHVEQRKGDDRVNAAPERVLAVNFQKIIKVSLFPVIKAGFRAIQSTFSINKELYQVGIVNLKCTYLAV